MSKQFKHPTYRKWVRKYEPYRKRWMRFLRNETAEELRTRKGLEELFAKASKKFRDKLFERDRIDKEASNEAATS